MEEKIIEKLQQFEPCSIFLYGSRGRGDHQQDSDYEVGVIFEDGKAVKRSILHEKINLDSVRIYPFKLSEISAGSLDTPFPNSIYARELIEGGKTIFGKSVIEKIDPPKINTLDVIRRVRFDIGYSVASVLSNRSGDTETASEEVSKSCLFGLRSLIILKMRKFVCGYDEIYKLRNELGLEARYIDTIEKAYAIRQGSLQLQDDIVFDNVSFLDYVEVEILKEFAANGVTNLA